jgi:hypothetical protein
MSRPRISGARKIIIEVGDMTSKVEGVRVEDAAVRDAQYRERKKNESTSGWDNKH